LYIALFLTAWAVSGFSAALVRGQPAENGEATASQPAGQPAASDPAAAKDADGESTRPLREQTIYIPYTKLRSVFEKEGRGVFLPYEKFQELWKKAQQSQQTAPEPRPPVDALISEISSEATALPDVLL